MSDLFNKSINRLLVKAPPKKTSRAPFVATRPALYRAAVFARRGLALALPLPDSMMPTFSRG